MGGSGGTGRTSLLFGVREIRGKQCMVGYFSLRMVRIANLPLGRGAEQRRRVLRVWFPRADDGKRLPVNDPS